MARSRWLFAVCCMATALAKAPAQDSAPAPKEPRRIELPRGAELSLPREVTKDQLAEMLEDYARKLRDVPPGKIKPASAPAPAHDPAARPAYLTPAELAAQPPRHIAGVATADSRADGKIDAKVEAKSPPGDDVGEHPAAEEGAIVPWFPNHRFNYLPKTLLWQPPLANHYEPRSWIKFLSLDSKDVSPGAESGAVTDFNLGATFGVFRMAPAGSPDDGFQLDIFGVASSRFISLEDATATDFRAGVPLTFARGLWSFKVAYEHTSTHVGDEFLVRNNVPLRDGIREDIAFGVAYWLRDNVRLYGVFAHAIHISALEPNPDPERFYFGAEWSRPYPTGWCGQPFAAIDVDLRGDQDYSPNVTAQVGWQWLAEAARPGMRLTLEYYDGRTPFGQFMDRHENWFAFGLAFDY